MTMLREGQFEVFLLKTHILYKDCLKVNFEHLQLSSQRTSVGMDLLRNGLMNTFIAVKNFLFQVYMKGHITFSPIVFLSQMLTV